MNRIYRIFIAFLFIVALLAVGIFLHEAGAHKVFLVLLATAILINGMNYFWRRPEDTHHHLGS